MLSRVAESLYWTGRYIERAEDTSRLLHVNFHGLLDADHSERRLAGDPDHRSYDDGGHRHHHVAR